MDKRSVYDYMGIFVNEYKGKVRVEEKVFGIVFDELSELENFLDIIIVLEENVDVEL